MQEAADTLLSERNRIADMTIGERAAAVIADKKRLYALAKAEIMRHVTYCEVYDPGHSFRDHAQNPSQVEDMLSALGAMVTDKSIVIGPDYRPALPVQSEQ